MTLILIVASVTLMGSFLCSLFEAALYAITPSQVELLRNSGKAQTRILADLRENISEPIAAILTINTITHTIGSAWCGAMVGEMYGSTSVGIFAGIFTLLVLVVTEIIPKSIGVKHASTVGPMMAYPLRGMIWSVWPIVKASEFLIRHLTGTGSDSSPSEDEVMIMSRLAARGGKLRLEEQLWVENVLRLDKIRATDLLTPRPVVQTFPRDTPVEDFRNMPETWKHSRVPITEDGDADKITGLVHRREIFDALTTGPSELLLADFEHPITFVPEAMAGHKLLDDFLRRKQHMFAVLDEYGGFSGVLTLEDVLECMIGTEIVDEHDEVADMQELARERARERGVQVTETEAPGESEAE